MNQQELTNPQPELGIDLVRNINTGTHQNNMPTMMASTGYQRTREMTLDELML